MIDKKFWIRGKSCTATLLLIFLWGLWSSEQMSKSHGSATRSCCPPYTDLYMVVGNKSGQASNSQNFRLFVQNLRTNKILAVAPPMLKKVTVSDLSMADFDIFKLLNIDYKRVNTQYGGPQDSLQLLGLEEPMEAQETVSVKTHDTTPTTEDTTPTTDEKVGQQSYDIREAYEENLNVKRIKRVPNRFKNFEMYTNVVLTSGIDLNELSLYQRNISKLDATHRNGFLYGVIMASKFLQGQLSL